MVEDDQDSSPSGRRDTDSIVEQLSPATGLETDSPKDSAPTYAGVENVESAANADVAPSVSPAPHRADSRWRVLAAISAVLLTALTIAAVYLLTRKPSTVDQVVILTVPSGAEIKLDAKDYGHSPVKLEQLPIGTYTITITKEGFEPIISQETIFESRPYEYKLKPLPPSGFANLPPDEAIRTYQQQAEDAFARGYYGIVYEGSALSYAMLILDLDGSNAFALEMQERIRKTAHQSGQGAISRGDLAQAQEIYGFLTEYFPKDEEARAALVKVESQLSNRRGELRGLVRKAEEALKAGNLIEPKDASAYYYSNQALAINRQDADARRVRNQVREKLAAHSEQAFGRGDAEAAIKQLEHLTQLFPEDKPLRARLREMFSVRNAEAAKANEPSSRRVRGLDLYRNERYSDAIPDLQFAMLNGLGKTDVVFALARSYMMTGDLDKATFFFRKVPESGDDSYRSGIAALGEIARLQGDTPTALERFKEARRLGGSLIYPIATLDDKIEKIERREREKAAEPTPLTLQVRHLHGGLLGGSCGGPLSVNSTGVRYDGSEHQFSANLVGVGVEISRDEMSVKFQKSVQKFKVARSEGERFREALSRFQQTYSSK
ncbi:MAG: PEGA domain-containing protein [Acidobacteriota bacterium]